MLEDIKSLADHAFEALEDFEVTRVGLRYINVLVPEVHMITSVHDFRFKVSVDDTPLEEGINLNFIRKNEQTTHTVRIASPEFISNMRPSNGVAVVDIDSSTVQPENLSNPDEILEWATKAHDEEKGIFFSLFEDEQLNKIVEEWQ